MHRPPPPLMNAVCATACCPAFKTECWRKAARSRVRMHSERINSKIAHIYRTSPQTHTLTHIQNAYINVLYMQKSSKCTRVRTRAHTHIINVHLNYPDNNLTHSHSRVLMAAGQREPLKQSAHPTGRHTHSHWPHSLAQPLIRVHIFICIIYK